MTQVQVDRLCEAVADISFIACEKKYYSGNSREDIASFIEWAKEFEKKYEGIEWGENSEDDYYDTILDFTIAKINSHEK